MEQRVDSHSVAISFFLRMSELRPAWQASKKCKCQRGGTNVAGVGSNNFITGIANSHPAMGNPEKREKKRERERERESVCVPS